LYLAFWLTGCEAQGLLSETTASYRPICVYFAWIKYSRQL